MLGQVAQRAEQLIDLVGNEDRCRLVEDEDAGAPVQHLEDLDALLVADAELVDHRVGIDVEAVPVGQRPDATAGLADVEPHGVAGLATEDDVLPHREVVGQHEVLEDHADAGLDGVGRGAEVAFTPFDDDRALVGPMGAVQRLHQRRLAGSVLTDDGVDRVRLDREADAVVGDDAREPLDDVAQLDGGNRSSRPPPRCPLSLGSFSSTPGSSGMAKRPAQARGVLSVSRRRQGVVGTSISPSMICCLNSSSWSAMSSTKPPEVA